MTNKPSKPINLFDVQASQKVIGQENFLKAFETILNHGGYAQGPECRELDESWQPIPVRNTARPAVRALMR